MGNIILKKGKDEAVKRFHPWIFSGAIHELPKEVKEGDIVTVLDARKEVLGRGYYAGSNIAVRMLTFEDREINLDFWKDKLMKSYALRKLLGLVNSENTNAYRLVHGEGDGLPGLIIDYYHGTAVIQCHAVGMYLQLDWIKEALIFIYQSNLNAIFDKSKETLPHPMADKIENGYLFERNPASKEREITKVLENGHLFYVDWETGQKTGFFLDQRENRAYMALYCKQKTVLNTFCYTGGFSVFALKAGASLVHSVDVSGKAIELTDANVMLNQPFEGVHVSFKADVLQYFKNTELLYDIVVVDPPAYAKNISKRHNAVQGYRRLNAAAIERVAPGGLMFTFSCSQVVDRALFYHTIVAAALDAGRNIKVLQHLSQAPDHPVSIYHPEGGYLKGLLLYVE